MTIKSTDYNSISKETSSSSPNEASHDKNILIGIFNSNMEIMEPSTNKSIPSRLSSVCSSSYSSSSHPLKHINPYKTLLDETFYTHNHKITNIHPKTIPHQPPDRRGKRHRSWHFRMTNNFRHWWKTSRLLVRLSGLYVLCTNSTTWTAMQSIRLWKMNKNGIKSAMKLYVKPMGRGGSNEPFLNDVHPFTRTLRIYMALGRAFESRVDNRFFQVLFAEAFAFMGNRSARYWARTFTDCLARYIVFPFTGTYIIHPYLKQIETMIYATPIIITIMGVLRAVLPFLSSFVGSAIGRKTTFAAIHCFNNRWNAIQSIDRLDPYAGTYESTNEDPHLVHIAQKVALTISHGLDGDQSNIRHRLFQSLGFHMVGSGSGGLAVYKSENLQGSIHNDPSGTVELDFSNHYPGCVYYLHVTPYGPSVLNEMPRYIVIEKRETIFMHDTSYDRDIIRNSLKSKDYSERIIPMLMTKPTASIAGFTYSGAFFTSQEFASLRQRYDRELSNYQSACLYMGKKSHTATTLYHDQAFPPTNLLSLKAFVRTGRDPPKKKRDNKGYLYLMKQVENLTNYINILVKDGKAPTGIIIYLEGLDCAGKSSTSGFVQKALSQAGYDIVTVQYNKPPTDAEKKQPWMWRFDKSTFGIDDNTNKKVAIVWDRGPAGDFVYGNLGQLSSTEKCERYVDFNKFENECRNRNILFCKLLFISDRDSIAETLGKRLAHKKIVQDLHTWLDANSSDHEREGLNEIENHIDPTDFIAFNKYQSNLLKFYEFVRQTEYVRSQMNSQAEDKYENPWLVVSTSKRQAARVAIMKCFQMKLKAFANQMFQKSNSKVKDEESDFLVVKLLDDSSFKNKFSFRIFMKKVFYVLVLIMIPYSYLHQSWKVRYVWEDEE